MPKPQNKAQMFIITCFLNVTTMMVLTAWKNKSLIAILDLKRMFDLN